MAYRMINKKAKVLVMPHGSMTLPIISKMSEGKVV
jgi:hypothetical protein